VEDDGMAEAPTPDMVAARLPLYLRTLDHMVREGLTVTSSQQIGARLGLSPAQIRKDLSYFGKFGKQGTGYNIVRLREQLERILHVDRQWPLALVGAGALGLAVMHYGGFRERGFYIASVFDNAPGKVGQRVAGYTVLPSDSIAVEVPKRDIRVAVVAVPPEAAQDVVDRLVRAGVRAILNYAPISLIAPPGVQVQQIDPVVHLQHMTFYLEPTP
jgi:redox-sensing transcriptional repressor